MTGSNLGSWLYRSRTFAFTLGVIILFFISLTLYLQTPHAFTHVIIPLVQKYVPGQIDVEHGSITFPAMIELRGLSYQHQESGLSVHSTRLLLRVSAIRLLWDRELLIEDLNLDQSEVRFEPEPRQPIQEEQAAQPSGKVDILLLPLGVRRMTANDLTISITTESSEFTAHNMNLSVREIHPGRSGVVELRGDVTFDRLEDGTRWAGGVFLNGTIEQSTDRKHIIWNGTNEVALREWPLEGLAAGSEPVTFLHSLSGSYDVAAATIRHVSSLTIDQGQTHLGKLSLGLTQNETSAGARTDIALVVQEITAEALNLGLARDRAIRLHAIHLGGHMNIHSEGKQYTVSSAISGKQLQVVADGEKTSPLDIDVVQAGRTDLRSNSVTLERFQILIAENGTPRLSGEIDRPLTILIGPETSQPDNALSQSDSHSEGTITIHKFDVSEVRQWLHVFGLEGFPGVSAGELRGRFAISSHNRGHAMGINGKLTISDIVMNDLGTGTAQVPMTFAHEFHGTVSDLTMLDLRSWTITGAIHNRVRGAMTLSGTINLRDPMARPSLKGSLGLVELPAEMLNPVLARWTDTRVVRSQLNGTAQVELAGDTVTWKIQLKGQQLTLWLPASKKTTVPLDVDLSQEGNADWTAGILQLDKATVRVFEQSRPVITAVLNKPVRLPLPGSSDEPSLPRVETQPTEFTVKINRLGFPEISSRLSLWNITTLDQIKSGYIDAQLTIHWKGVSEPTSAAGSLNVTNLRLDSGTVHIREPIRIQTKFDATVSDFSLVQIKTFALQALFKSTILAKTELSGSANLNHTSMNLAVSFIANNIPMCLAKFGLLDEQQLKLFTSGAIKAEGDVITHGQNHPISVRVKATAGDLRFQPLPGQFLSYTLRTQGNLKVNEERTVLSIQPADLTIQTSGKEKGTLTVEGRWPVGLATSLGSIRLVAKNFDLGPLAELSKAFPGRSPAPLPVNGDVTLAMEPRSRTFTLRGTETIGPVHVSRKDGGPSSGILRITHDLTREKDAIQVKSLRLEADHPQGIPDQVTVNGPVHVTGKQSGPLKVDITSLDAGWYAALFSAPQSSTPLEKRQKAATQPVAQQNSSNSPGVLLGLDTELTLGSISYGKLTAGPGRLTSKGTGDRRQVKLEPTGFADGKIEATAEFDVQRGRNDFTWTGKGEALNVEKILQTIEPGEESRAKGSGSFTTSGHGILNTDSLRQHLVGTFDFEIKHGEFLRAPLLQLLSDYTHIDALAHMGFDGLKATLRMKDGWIHIDPISVTGSAALLDGNISISPTSIVDGRIFARIGPSFSKSIRIPCMSALLKTPDGFTALPFAVQIKGPLENFSYSVDTAGWKYTKGAIGALTDTMMNLLQGCREENPEGDATPGSQSRPKP